VGAPTGLNPKIFLQAITKIFRIFVEQGKIMEAEEPTVRMHTRWLVLLRNCSEIHSNSDELTVGS